MANTVIVAGLAITPARLLLLGDIAAFKVADDDEGAPQLDIGEDGTARVAEAVWLMYQAGLCWQPDGIPGWRLTEIGSDVLEGRLGG